MNIKKQEIIEKYLSEATTADYEKLSTSELKDLLDIFKNVGRSSAQPVLKALKGEWTKRLKKESNLDEAKVVPFKSLEQAWSRTDGDKDKQAKLIKKYDLKKLISSVRPGEIKLGIKNKLLGTTKAATAAGLDSDDELIFITNNPLKIIYPKKSNRRPEGEEIKESVKAKDLDTLRLERMVSLVINESNQSLIEAFVDSSNIDITTSPSKMREAYKAFNLTESAELIRKVSKETELHEASMADIKKVLAAAKKAGADIKGNKIDFGEGSLIDVSIEKGKIKFDGGMSTGVEYFNNAKDAIMAFESVDLEETKRMKYDTVIKKLKDGEWDTSMDVKQRMHLTYTDNNTGKKKVVFVESLQEADGWIAFFNGKKLEISKKDASSLYSAKLFAINKLKVPKSKQGLLAIEPAYNESTDLEEGTIILKTHSAMAAERLKKKLTNKFFSSRDQFIVKGSDLHIPDESHIVRLAKKQPEIKESTDLEEARKAFVATANRESETITFVNDAEAKQAQELFTSMKLKVKRSGKRISFINTAEFKSAKSKVMAESSDLEEANGDWVIYYSSSQDSNS